MDYIFCVFALCSLLCNSKPFFPHCSDVHIIGYNKTLFAIVVTSLESTFVLYSLNKKGIMPGNINVIQMVGEGVKKAFNGVQELQKTNCIS